MLFPYVSSSTVSLKSVGADGRPHRGKNDEYVDKADNLGRPPADPPLRGPRRGKAQEVSVEARDLEAPPVLTPCGGEAEGGEVMGVVGLGVFQRPNGVFQQPRGV